MDKLKWIDMEWIDCRIKLEDESWRDMTGKDAEKIIKCVNENEKLKEALRKCNPYVNVSGTDILCYSCNKPDWSMQEHKDDCEYEKLTK